MARRPLATQLADAASECAVTRRRFLRDTGAFATAAMAASSWGRLIPAARGATAGRVVVVGAGLAGLTCAYRLKQAGVEATVYEAPTASGGRCWTRRGDFAAGQIVEHGGELIDQGHTAIRQLAQSLGLDLDNLLAAEVNGTEQFNYWTARPTPTRRRPTT